MNHSKAWLANNTNVDRVAGSVSDAMAGADVFLGLSGPGLVTRADVETMAERPIVFAMANPDPEILPDAIADIVGVMATGRSDYPNQINNVLAFPGIFRGAFDAGATDITENMKIAAADAIAAAVSSDDLSPDLVIPTAFDRSVVPAVANAVATAAISDGVTRNYPTAAHEMRPHAGLDSPQRRTRAFFYCRASAAKPCVFLLSRVRRSLALAKSGRDRRRSGDLTLFRRALCQLSYPTAVPTGFEPATSGLTGQRELQTSPRDQLYCCVLAPALGPRSLLVQEEQR